MNVNSNQNFENIQQRRTGQQQQEVTASTSQPFNIFNQAVASSVGAYVRKTN